MMHKKFNVICATDENLGIGKNNGLPWKLPWVDFCYLEYKRLKTARGFCYRKQ